MTDSEFPATKNMASNIIDVDMTNFIADVIETSMEIPVIVDFWAPWCEPCKVLIPILEKVIGGAGNNVRLAKVNIDEAQEIAAQMQIRSVPTVVAFVNGRPVDAFAGVKSESEVREFLSKVAPDLGPSEIETILTFAKELYDEKNFQEAGGAYSQALQMENDNPVAIAGLANCLIKLNDLENAELVLSEVSDKNKNNPAIAAARAALDTLKQMGDVGDMETLQSAVDKNPNDHENRFNLALVLWGENQREEAADNLLYIISNNKEWQDGAARKQLLKFFEMAGPTDPFTLSARRKLSSLLFS